MTSEMPPAKFSQSDVELVLKSLEEFRQQVDKRFTSQDGELSCIQESINGTATVIGMAGRLRNAEAWRDALDRPDPLILWREKVQIRHDLEDAARAQIAKDWRAIAIPIVVQLLSGALGAAAVLIGALRAGIIH